MKEEEIAILYVPLSNGKGNFWPRCTSPHNEFQKKGKSVGVKSFSCFLFFVVGVLSALIMTWPLKIALNETHKSPTGTHKTYPDPYPK